MNKTKVISALTIALLASSSIGFLGNTQVKAAENVAVSSTSTEENNITVQVMQDGKSVAVNPDGLYFQILPNTDFDPLNFTGTDGSQYKITTKNGNKITVNSNTVDTSKPGSVGTVKLTVENTTGSAQSVTFTVFVKPSGLFTLKLPQSYVTGLGDTDTVYQGQEYYITNNVKFAEGEFFTGISNQSQNANNNSVKWIATKYLADSATQKSEPSSKTLTRTLMHTSVLYDKEGNSTGEKYNSYRKITINPEIVTIKNSSFVKLAHQDLYIKASNVYGNGRVLKHNAYIYATSKKRADRITLKKGQTITTYGGSYKFKNGKRYYRIQGASATNKRYVKVANFK